MYSRREWLRLSLTGTAAAILTRSVPAVAAPPAQITVYKSPSCGCCKKWVEHLGKNGFTVAVKDMDDVGQIKTSLGVPTALQSCHTAVIAGSGYIIEGHVPADVIRKLQKERPKIAGLAVPGMPSDAPGMDGSGNGYQVIAFERNGKTRVYASR